jgi:LysM repeat protein
MTPRLALPAVAALCLVACNSNRTDVDYDTADPYGIPDYSDTGYGPETANYEAVNPPADSSYGPAAYEDNTNYTPAPTPAPAAARSHTIVKGDTLWGLSRKYGVSIDAIKAANNMTGDTVVLGKTLRIPAN